ncbi:unnamed protein product [Ectocarpus fasciculatus]
MFSPELRDDGPETTSISADALGAFDELVRAVQAVAGGVSAEEARQRVVVVWAAAHGAVNLAAGGLLPRLGAGLDVDALAERVADAAVQLSAGSVEQPLR